MEKPTQKLTNQQQTFESILEDEIKIESKTNTSEKLQLNEIKNFNPSFFFENMNQIKGISLIRHICETLKREMNISKPFFLIRLKFLLIIITILNNNTILYGLN